MSPSETASPAQLLALILDDQWDVALAAGLMDYVPQPGDEQLVSDHPELPLRLQKAQQQLQCAWAARERYRQRQRRLARRAAERDARRAPPPTPEIQKPALPSAAAAILARAKAKAAGRTS